MGAIEALSQGSVEAIMEHHPLKTVSLTRKRTTFDGWLGWGGTPLKKYQGRPKVCSSESEIRSRVQKQKQA